jgi:hypothetical protein
MVESDVTVLEKINMEKKVRKIMWRSCPIKSGPSSPGMVDICRNRRKKNA